jgi:hypothetical protein
MAGATAVSGTVNGALLALSAVTTICADDWPLKRRRDLQVDLLRAGVEQFRRHAIERDRYVLSRQIASPNGGQRARRHGAGMEIGRVGNAADYDSRRGRGAGAVTVRVSGKLWLPAMGPASISTVAW